MPYKDKEKQKEFQRKWEKRYHLARLMYEQLKRLVFREEVLAQKRKSYFKHHDKSLQYSFNYSYGEFGKAASILYKLEQRIKNEKEKSRTTSVKVRNEARLCDHWEDADF